MGYTIAPGHGRDLPSLEPVVSGTGVLGLGANCVVATVYEGEPASIHHAVG